MGRGNVGIAAHDDSVRCTCIDCQCRPRVQQRKPNTDLYQSHFLRNSEPIQFDTTVRSNFKQPDGVPTLPSRKAHPDSVLTFGNESGMYDTTHKDQYKGLKGEKPELKKTEDGIKRTGSSIDFSTTTTDNYKKPQDNITFALGTSDGPAHTSVIANTAHFDVGNEGHTFDTMNRHSFAELKGERAALARPKDSKLWDPSADDYDTTTRNIYTSHRAHKLVVDKFKHPAEQNNIKQGQEQLDYTTVSANSFKFNGMPSPKRAENHLHKTAIWRSNSTDFQTTNQQNFKKMSVEYIVDNTERQKNFVNSSIYLGNDSPVFSTETQKNFIKTEIKRETITKPDLQKSHIYVKEDPTEFTTLNKLDFKRHSVKAVVPPIHDRGHHFSFGSEAPDHTTITKEAYVSPPLAALQISHPEIVYKTNIPIATATSAFQQQTDNNFMTSQKQDFTKHQLEKIARSQAPNTSVILGTATNPYATSYTGDYVKNCCFPAVDHCCCGYFDSPSHSTQKGTHKHKISPPQSARKSECCC